MAKWLADFGSRGPGFESLWRQNSTHDYMVFHCTEPFIINLPSCDIDNVERAVKHQLTTTYRVATSLKNVFEGYGYTSRGGSMVSIVFATLLKRGLLIKEQIPSF